MPFVLGIGAKLLGVSQFFHTLASRLPWQVWVGIGVAILLVIGFIWHSHAKKRFGDDHYTAGYNDGFAKAKELAAQANAKVEVKGDAMAAKVRSENDAKTVSIDRAARDVLVHGPGRAACAPVASAAANGAAGSVGVEGNAAVSGVPAGEGQQLIGLPVDAATAFGRQNDKALADNASWWSWYDRYNAIIADYQRQIAALTAKGKAAK